MAKRQRGGARPGQRAPLQKGRPATPTPNQLAEPARPAGGLSDDELARAAELEARIVAEEQAASTSTARGRDRRRQGGSGAPVARARGAASLTSIADDEYRYVISDLRKIVVVFVGIFGLLLLSWLLIVVTGIVAV